MKKSINKGLNCNIYREIFERSGNAWILLEDIKRLKLIAGNKAAIKIFNLNDEKELVSTSFYNFLPKLQLDGKYSADCIKKIMVDFKKRKSYVFELTCRKKDGILFLARIFIFAINKGKVICANIKDITKEKEAEKKLKLFSILTEQNPSLIVLTNKKGEIIYVNKKFSDVTGYSYEEAQGKNPRILKSESDPEKYQNLWNTITSGEVWRGEFYNRKKNGSHYWAFATIAPIKDEKGMIKEFIGIQEDITEKKDIEKKLNEKIIELESFQKATIDRELKMIELKKEINLLLKRQNLSPKYKI